MRIARLLAAVRIAAALSCLLPASLAAAQDAATAKDDARAPIVVTGTRDGEQKSIRKQTRSVAVAVEGQVARFAGTICADSIGLPPDLNKIVADRIAADAIAAGIPVGKPGCQANVIVAMVPDGRAALRVLIRNQPQLFIGFDRETLKKLLADTGPAHVMTLTTLRSRDGKSLSIALPGMPNGFKGDAPFLQVDNASILGPPTRQVIGGALVLLDQPALTGKTLRQIADYAAMRTLAMTREPPATPAGETILTLFGGGPAPSEITGFDLSYLKSLYRGPPTRSYSSAVGEMARDIGKRRRDDDQAGDDKPAK
ncbi:hypothetical protein [uncultured Sphingomonas sp.]|uniref:hypothetical protein n=1 Tax=uncultured Sphingomonas sp. TaxID=158754 RepID=UPI0035CB893A